MVMHTNYVCFNNNNLVISATSHWQIRGIECKRSELPLDTARFRGIAHRETI